MVRKKCFQHFITFTATTIIFNLCLKLLWQWEIVITFTKLSLCNGRFEYTLSQLMGIVKHFRCGKRFSFQGLQFFKIDSLKEFSKFSWKLYTNQMSQIMRQYEWEKRIWRFLNTWGVSNISDCSYFNCNTLQAGSGGVDFESTAAGFQSTRWFDPCIIPFLVGCRVPGRESSAV